MKPNKSDTAFPCSSDSHFKGMSLRDYFAGQILAGDAASAEGWETCASDEVVERRARFYYRMADAMLEARGDK